jgi:cytoskeletal protein RodZ
VPATGSENKTCPVGSYLRESRESRGISLDDAAQVTRISRNYLIALEEERFDILPNPAYTRGFLRAYASFLGLSGDKAIAMYERAVFPAVPETPEHTENVSYTVPGDASGTSFKWQWVVPLFLLALVVVASYLFSDKETGKEKNPSVPQAVLPVPAVPAPVLPPRSSSGRPSEQAAGRDNTTTSDAIPAGTISQSGGSVLKLKVNQDSSLNVTIDGMISQQYDLKAGDLIEWKADKVITLELGNAGGIEAEFNGRPLKPFGEPGKSAHVVLKADAPLP